MNRTAPLPWTRAAREAEALRLTEAEMAALGSDERLANYPLSEWTTAQQRNYLALLRWQWRRRWWNERLDDQ